MLAPSLFNIFFAAVVAYTRFKADKDIVDALVHIGHIISHISHISHIKQYYGEIKNDFFFKNEDRFDCLFQGVGR